MQKRKLQVFVSSTYTDMIDERQAAVEAILVAGHIPAGMELFAAGDESQLEVIRRWIDESDVFLLLLGGRYGSVDPATGKSYVHLEYERAVGMGKPLFSVVIEEAALEDKVRRLGSTVIETENSLQLKRFRAEVLTRIVRFWRDPRDIKLAILEALSEYSRRDELGGWTRSTVDIDIAALAEEIARLGKENAMLRAQLSSNHAGDAGLIYEGLTFDEFYRLLVCTTVASDNDLLDEPLRQTARTFGDDTVGLLHLLWVLEFAFRNGLSVKSDEPLFRDAERLQDYGALQHYGSSAAAHHLFSKTYRLSQVGQQFLLRLRVKRNGAAASIFQLAANP